MDKQLAMLKPPKLLYRLVKSEPSVLTEKIVPKTESAPPKEVPYKVVPDTDNGNVGLPSPL